MLTAYSTDFLPTSYGTNPEVFAWDNNSFSYIVLVGSYVMSSVTGSQFTLTGTSGSEGVTVVAAITKNGISGMPVIALP